MAFSTPVELGLSREPVGGLLAAAGGLPTGWERGISFQDTACFKPVTMGECPSVDGLKPTQRAGSVTFKPVSLIQAITCSTLGGLDVARVAQDALNRTADYALARELLTGEASRRDAKDGIGNPALSDVATDLGADFTSLAAAVACLSQNLAESTGHTGGYLLVSPGLAVHLVETGVVRNGFTGSGLEMVVSAGFDGRGLSTDNPAVPGVNEVQSYDINPDDATGGTYTITFPGVGTTAGIAPGATTAEIQAAVDAVLGVGNSVVSGAYPGAVTIEYTGTLGEQDVPELTVDATGLTGVTGGYAAVVTTVTPGAEPIPASITPAPAPVAGDPLYMYAVPSLWAGVGSRSVFSDVDRSINDANARAEDIALVAFSTCAVFAAASTSAVAC